jgi:hypothetical protein
MGEGGATCTVLERAPSSAALLQLLVADQRIVDVITGPPCLNKSFGFVMQVAAAGCFEKCVHVHIMRRASVFFTDFLLFH